MSSSRQDLEAQIHASVGKTRIRWIKQWMETVSCTEHKDSMPDFMVNEPDVPFDRQVICDACAQSDKPMDNRGCYCCDRKLCVECMNQGAEGDCVLCSYKQNFFIVCACGVDECYNYWGINPLLDTHFLCRKHKQPVADRCAYRIKCATCRNTVVFPFCEKCDGVFPDVVKCNTCQTWTIK